jgi:CMP-N,N'-diacetyllegionaminic acid synthase
LCPPGQDPKVCREKVRWPLQGRPLILYTIDFIRKFADDEDICLTTDSIEIIEMVKQQGLNVPFVRPAELATDTAPSYDFIMHALRFFEARGIRYERTVLLQSTSPFRRTTDLQQMLNLYHADMDMLVSVKKPRTNPYFNLFAEDENGYLRKLLASAATRRQDCPDTWEYNGSVYIMNNESLKKSSPAQFTRVVKFEMPEIWSVDIDILDDFQWAEFLCKPEKSNWITDAFQRTLSRAGCLCGLCRCMQEH